MIWIRLLSIVWVIGTASAAAENLVVYTYDSMAASGGLGPLLKAQFAKQGHTLQFVSFGSAGEAYNQVQLDGKKGRADIVLGLDNALRARAQSSGHFETVAPELARAVGDAFHSDYPCFLPFDYGYLAFVYDSSRTPTPAAGIGLVDFSKTQSYRKKVVMEDPRTSSLGLSFLIWTHLVSPRETKDLWQGLLRQILTFTPGWSGAYGLFLKKEADFVLSYSTSPAYHIEKESRTNFRALIFPEGHYRQVEGAAILKTSSKKVAAKALLSLLISPELQREIPLTNWMYPVLPVPLPKSFESLPVPKALPENPKETEAARARWLEEWVQWASRAPS